LKEIVERLPLGAIHLWHPHGGVRLRWTYVYGGGDQLQLGGCTEN